MTTLASPLIPSHSHAQPVAGINRLALGVALTLLLLGGAHLWTAVSPRQAALWLVGAMLGLSLYHSLFGFTHAWRAFITQGRGAGLRAQMLMLALGVLLFFPALHLGSVLGQPVRGLVFPAGSAVVLGAFIFGVGMQLGGGCASGTLFNAGAGNLRLLITLIFFITGTVLAALQYSWWSTLPALEPVSLIQSWGLWPALLAHLAFFGLVALFSLIRERRRHGDAIRIAPWPAGRSTLWRGSWPLAWGALALALLNFATLLMAGRPWGIVSAFPAWGSRLIMLSDAYDPTEWSYWMKNLTPLISPLQEDITSVMNIGLVLGAMTAAALAGRFANDWKTTPRAALASVVGGLMLGYGASLAFGCNIGAYFSGMLSGSLHAWFWLPSAFAGSLLGTALRPWFGLQRG